MSDGLFFEGTGERLPCELRNSAPNAGQEYSQKGAESGSQDTGERLKQKIQRTVGSIIFKKRRASSDTHQKSTTNPNTNAVIGLFQHDSDPHRRLGVGIEKSPNESALDQLESYLGTGIWMGQSRRKLCMFIQTGHINLILGEAFYFA